MPVVCTVNSTRGRKRHRQGGWTATTYFGFLTKVFVGSIAFYGATQSSTLPVHALTLESSSSNGISADSSISNIKNRLLILGLGRVGSEVAIQARMKGFDVVGTVRSLDPQTQQYENKKRSEVAIQARMKGFDVVGTVRSLDPQTQQYENKKSDNNKVSRIPFSKSTIRSVLPTCSHVLISIPPPAPSSTTSDADESDGKTDNDVMEIFDMVANELSTSSKCSWLGLISTTGVYGNHDGATVTEESNCYCCCGDDEPPDWNSPNSAVRLLRLEQHWQEQPCCCHPSNGGKTALNIFRCAGIYGPTRSALHTVYKEYRRGGGRRERQGNKIKDDSSKVVSTTTVPPAVTNRIHQVDIARAIVASMMQHVDTNKNAKHPSSSEDSSSSGGCQIYNLADDQPETREVVLQYAQALLEPFFPKEEEQQDDDSADTDTEETNLEIQQPEDSPSSSNNTSRRRRRQREQKIVANGKLKTQLLSKDGLLYPTYKEGLASVLQNREAPWWQQRLQRQAVE